MAVAGDAASPSPRIVVSAQALVRVAVLPLLYLGLATAWVLLAIGGAISVAHLAWGEGSAPFVFFLALAVAALKFSICIIFPFLALAAVMLCGLCLPYVIALVSGSGSEFKKTQSALGEITWESTREVLKFPFPHAVVLGLVAALAFILLSVAGTLVMLMSPSVEGSTSRGQMIGSVITDVGIIGFHAIFCVVIIPAFALGILRLDQADRKAGLTVAVC